jgi:uncharacterized protein YPO0396
MDLGLIEWLLPVPSLAKSVTKMAVVPAVHLQMAKKYPHVSHDAVPVNAVKVSDPPRQQLVTRLRSEMVMLNGYIRRIWDSITAMIWICHRPLASEAIEVQEIDQLLAEVMEHLRRLNEARIANQDLLNALFALIEGP